MICCDEMQKAMDYEMMTKTEKYKVRDGRVINDIETEYYIRSGNESGVFNYLGVNFCPFCGKPLSRGLWFAEKKK
ncbi:MAG TPA: hypothetical protein VH878_06635 [Thermodesulfobacteriota bacterium]